MMVGYWRDWKMAKYLSKAMREGKTVSVGPKEKKKRTA
jgi:hypothetical protein